MSQDPMGWYGRMIESDRNMQQQGAENLMAGVTSAVGSIAGAYADKSAMKAKAQSYGKIGDILGDTMFAENPNAMNALSELKKSKDPYEAVMGYETLFGMLGPMSNMMMAQGRMGVQQDQQQLSARMPDLRNQATNTATVAGQGGPSIMGATRRIGAPTGP